MTKTRVEAVRGELQRLYIDSTYSAQIHFEAAKSAEFFGKTLVFVPAVLAAISSLLVAFDFSKSWGALGAVAGAVAATATLLGPERKAPAYRESARTYTRIRQDARLEHDLLIDESDLGHASARLSELRNDYSATVFRDEPTPNRLYKRVDKRIGSGVLTYDGYDEDDGKTDGPKQP